MSEQTRCAQGCRVALRKEACGKAMEDSKSQAQVGTVNPILPVIAEFAKRGCDVRYYLTKEPT